MSKRRGLTIDEKRQRMLQLFHERRDFFQMKELERLGAREKGVISQSVKDVVQSLVDDTLVDTDKIGTCVYFWALPSRAVAARRSRIDQLRSQLEQREKQLLDRRRQLQETSQGREPTAERKQLMSQLTERREQLKLVEKQLEQLGDCDPDTVKRLKEQSETARAAVDRWTDNVFNVRSWCCSKLGRESAVIDKHFGIAEDFDYLA